MVGKRNDNTNNNDCRGYKRSAERTLERATQNAEHNWNAHPRATKAPTGNTMYPLVGKALAHLVSMQEVLRDHSKDIFLPRNKVKIFQDNTQGFLVSYQQLAVLAESTGTFLWDNPSKFHWVHHLAQKSLYLNPRKTNTFMDEDFVGRMKTVVHSAASGTELHRMADKSMEKYRWLLHFKSLCT